VSDFRLQQRPILSSMPALLKVLEHGEYTRGSLSDEGAAYRVEKWGRIIALTMEVLVNDQLDAFLKIQPGLGQSARRAEADAVYALFALNSGAGPTMPDGHPLFDSTNHHNVTASATALDAAALSAGRTLLRRQTALGGGYLSLVPAFLIVPPELETTAEMLLASGTRTATSTLDAENPEWISRLTLVVEPRLPTGAVYLATSPIQIDTVELGLLEENARGPVLDTRVGFDIDMTEHKRATRSASRRWTTAAWSKSSLRRWDSWPRNPWESRRRSQRRGRSRRRCGAGGRAKTHRPALGLDSPAPSSGSRSSVSSSRTGGRAGRDS
jgi:hypothetical protein